MAKPGPATEYAPWMCDLIVKVAQNPGQYQAAMRWEIGKKLGKKRPISQETFSKYRKEHPEFEEAWLAANTISQAIDEQNAYDFATGKIKGNATAFALLFNAKYRDEYKPSGEGNVTINNNLAIENLSIEEIQYRLARSEEVLTKSGYLLPNKNNIIEAEFTTDD